MNSITSVTSIPVSVAFPSAEHSQSAIPADAGAGFPPTGADRQASQQVHGDALKTFLDKINQQLADSNRSIRFNYDKSVNQLTVQVVDSATGEVVRQIPSRAMIAHEVAMRQYIGLLLNRKA
jgi:flagellar protein FlaG